MSMENQVEATVGVNCAKMNKNIMKSVYGVDKVTWIVDSFINDVDTDPDPGFATAGLDLKKLKTDFFSHRQISSEYTTTKLFLVPK